MTSTWSRGACALDVLGHHVYEPWLAVATPSFADMKNFEPACILRRTFAHTSLPVLACLLMCWKWEHPLSKRSLHHHVSLWNDSVLVKFASGAPKTPQWISTCRARCTLTCDCWSLAGHTKNARLGYGPGQLQFTLLQAGQDSCSLLCFKPASWNLMTWDQLAVESLGLGWCKKQH